MSAKAVHHAGSDTYFVLVRRFPLTRIRDDAHLAAAQDVLDALTAADLDDRGTREYLDVLTDLVEIYENAHVPIEDASEADVLRELMAANRLSQPQLSRRVGIAQSTISEVLNGRRTLTKGQILRLAASFGLKPTAFLPV